MSTAPLRRLVPSLEALHVSSLRRQDDVVRQAVSALAYDSERVAAAVAGARAGLLGLVASRLRRLRIPDVEGDEAVLLTALIDGLNTARLAPQAPLDPATAQRVLRTHLERLGRDFPPGA